MTFQTTLKDIDPRHLVMASDSEEFDKFDRLKEPQLDSLERRLRIHILPPTEDTHCEYWLGVYRQGTLKPGELLNSADLSELFARAINPGIAETRHVMITDTKLKSPRILSFIPARSDSGSPLTLESLADAQKTIISWPQRPLDCPSVRMFLAKAKRALRLSIS